MCDPSQFNNSVSLSGQSVNHGPTVFNPKIVVAAAACQAAAVAAALRSVGERFGDGGGEGRRRVERDEEGEDGEEEDENKGVRERGNGED